MPRATLTAENKPREKVNPRDFENTSQEMFFVNFTIGMKLNDLKGMTSTGCHAITATEIVRGQKQAGTSSFCRHCLLNSGMHRSRQT